MVSVRAAVEPWRPVLGDSPSILLQASFAGLPLVNQALAAANPIGGGAFIVTVRTLIDVLGRISISDVQNALRPAPPPDTRAPDTTGQVLRPVLTNVSKTGWHQYRVEGHSFLGGRVVHVRIVNPDTLLPVTNPDSLLGDWFNGNSGASGKLDADINIPILMPGTNRLSFSANDERLSPADQDHTSTLWSNTITIDA